MEHSSFVRTRFCESDAFGHISNVSYFIYLEQARVDFIADTHLMDNPNDWSFVTASAHCDYINQTFINQNLVIKTWVSHIGRTSVTLQHKIFDQTSEELIAKGEVVLVYFNFTEQKSKPLSERMVEKLKNYLPVDHKTSSGI